MRRFVILALGLSLAFAACSKKKDAAAPAAAPEAAPADSTTGGEPGGGAGSGSAAADPDEGGEAQPK